MEKFQQKLTKTAEIFERRPIDQQYGLFLLSDFIFEKATRLQNKYETAVKQLEAMEQEKVYYYERKVDSLDKEVHNLKQVQRFYQKVSSILVPKFNDHLERSMPMQDCEAEYSFRVLEMGEI